MKSLLVVLVLGWIGCLAGDAWAGPPNVAWKVSSDARGPKPNPTGDYFMDRLIERIQARSLPDGGAVVAGTTFDRPHHAIVVRYGPLGEELWRTLVDTGDARDTFALDVAVDSDGNVHVAAAASGGDFVIARLSPAGTLAWRAVLPTLAWTYGDDGDAFARLRIDAAGSIYVTVLSTYMQTPLSVAKFDASGRRSWWTTYIPVGYQYFYVRDMVVDATGHARVTGTAYRGSNGSDAVTIGLNADGAVEWQAVIGMGGGSGASPFALAIDGANAVYLAAHAGGVPPNDLIVVKYGADGTEAWRASIDVPSRTLSRAIGGFAVRADRGEAYLAWTGRGPNFLRSYVERFDGSGNEIWTADVEGTAEVTSNAVSVDGAGNAYVLSAVVQGGNADLVTVRKEAGSGIESWRATVGGAAQKDDHPQSIDITSDGGVLVAGSTYEDPNSAPMMTLVKYAASSAPRAAISLGVARDATYVYADSLYLTAMVRMESPAGTVSFLQDGVPIAVCANVRVEALQGTTDVGLAQCYFDYPEAGGGVSMRWNAIFNYPAGHALSGIQETASRTIRVAPGSSAREGMYWGGRDENGWGVSVTQHGEEEFVVIYAYDANGAPEWFVTPPMLPGDHVGESALTVSGELYRPRGSPFDRYDASQLRMGDPVGGVAITYSGATTATLIATVGEVTRNVALRRFDFGSEDFSAKLRVGDLWWGGDDQAGWGVSIAQQGIKAFVTWYTYRADGTNTFFVMPSPSFSGTRLSGTAFATTSSPWLGRYDAGALRMQDAGTLTIDFIDQDTADMTYDVQGVKQTKRIRRFPF